MSHSHGSGSITSGAVTTNGWRQDAGEATPETQPLFLVIDDTLVLRFSEKAPGSGIAFEHAHKLNQASYVLGQCFVYLTMIQHRPTDEVPTSIPCPGPNAF